MPQLTQAELEVSSSPLVNLDPSNMPAGLASGCLMDYHGHRLLLTVRHPTDGGLPLALEVEWLPQMRRMQMWRVGGLNILGRVQIDTTTGEVNEAASKLIDYGYVDVPAEIRPRLQKIDFHTGTVTESRDCTLWTADAIADPTTSARYGFAGHKHTDCLAKDVCLAKRPEYVSIPQCGHLPHEEKPEEVNRALLSFLSPWKGAGEDTR